MSGNNSTIEHTPLKKDFAKIAESGAQELSEFRPDQFIPSPRMIFVKLLPEIAMTKGGITIPDMAREERQVGTIVSINRVDADSYPFKVGDCLLIRKGGGDIVPFDEAEGDYRCLPWSFDGDSDILGCFPVDCSEGGC